MTAFKAHLNWASISLLSIACADGGLEDRRRATGSQTIATNATYSAIYSANSTEGSVSRLDKTEGAVTELPVGAEPARVAVIGDQIFVTLQGERAVAVLKDDADGFRMVDQFEVGTEPVGIVASEDGALLFVAESTAERVTQIDPTTHKVVRSWLVDGEPRWLALHPSGQSLYVASARGGRLTWVDLESGQAKPIALPAPLSFGFEGVFEMEGRITGDPAVSPDGEMLLVPTLFVDNQSPIAEAAPDEFGPGGGGYSTSGGNRRFNPSVTMVPVGRTGEPETPTTEDIILMDAFTPLGVATSYPSSVTVSPDGATAAVTMEGSQAVIIIELESTAPGTSILDVFNGGFEGDFASDSLHAGRSFGYATEAGPNGAVFTSDKDLHVFNFLDRTIAEIDTTPALEALDGKVDFDEVGSRDDFQETPLIFESSFFVGAFQGPSVIASRSTLHPDVEAGRRLFFSANDSRMSGTDSGLSCATCHFRGRDDGITWHFERGPRQTPSLAGDVSLTAPVRWEGDRATVADDAMSTSQGLMGGQGLQAIEAIQIEAFINRTREVDHPTRKMTDPRARRGEEIFYRPEVGCGNCHSGARYTDNKSYFLLGMNVQTRSLTGISRTAPYMHDGSLATLSAVLKASRFNNMGDTSMLNQEEMADLEYYLTTL